MPPSGPPTPLCTLYTRRWFRRLKSALPSLSSPALHPQRSSKYLSHSPLPPPFREIFMKTVGGNGRGGVLSEGLRGSRQLFERGWRRRPFSLILAKAIQISSVWEALFRSCVYYFIVGSRGLIIIAITLFFCFLARPRVKWRESVTGGGGGKIKTSNNILGICI